jgi:membrane-associated protein
MIDFLLHVDERLLGIVDWAGPWAYVVLFAIIFAETGFVVTPFLPGDSLHFAAGALAATGVFDMRVLVPSLILAAISGNTVNYSVGARVARRFLAGDGQHIEGPLGRYVKPKHIHEAHAFFLRHGGKAVTLAQFVPIVRTFLPFVAGGAGMPYRAFLTYNAVGAVAWVSICAGAGYLFGNIPVVKENFELVVLGIVGVSLLPIVVEFVKMRRRQAVS